MTQQAGHAFCPAVRHGKHLFAGADGGWLVLRTAIERARAPGRSGYYCPGRQD